MSLSEEIRMVVMQLTDAQKVKVLDYAKALRQKDENDITATMETIVTENEEAFKELGT